MRLRAAVLVLAAVVAVPGVASSDPWTAEPLPAPARPPWRRFFVLGAGPGGLTGNDLEPYSNAVAFNFQFGLRRGPAFAFLVGFDNTMFARYTPDPELAQTCGTLFVGARWTALESAPSRLGTLALHLRGTVGLGQLTRMRYGSLFADTERGDWGPAVGLAVGLRRTMPDASGAALGVELGDQLIWFDPGLRHAFGLTITLELPLF